jgi:hypothetical protein
MHQPQTRKNAPVTQTQPNATWHWEFPLDRHLQVGLFSGLVCMCARARFLVLLFVFAPSFQGPLPLLSSIITTVHHREVVASSNQTHALEKPPSFRVNLNPTQAEVGRKLADFIYASGLLCKLNLVTTLAHDLTAVISRARCHLSLQHRIDCTTMAWTNCELSNGSLLKTATLPQKLTLQ